MNKSNNNTSSTTRNKNSKIETRVNSPDSLSSAGTNISNSSTKNLQHEEEAYSIEELIENNMVPDDFFND